MAQPQALQAGHQLLSQLARQLSCLRCKSASNQVGLLRLGTSRLQLAAAAAAGPSSSRALATGASSGRQNRSAFRRLKALLRDYKQLSKFRLSALVALTASAGFAAGSGEAIDYEKLAWTSLGTLGAAACANTLNQLYEVANDARMARTCNRPLPGGRLGSRHALAFALLTGVGGLWTLAEQTNPLTTALGAANIVLYAGIYTPLKQLSIYNTWVGAVVGAIPPLMGWAAAAGELEPGSWVLAAALFSWQLPHFLALAWMCQDDYARGGFRMLPKLDPLGSRTAAVALRHCALLLPLGAVAAALHVASPWFAAEAAALAAAMGAGALAFRANPTAASARKLFRGSLLYLPLLLAALAVHRQPNRHVVTWPDVQQQAHTAAAVQRHSCRSSCSLGACGSSCRSCKRSCTCQSCAPLRSGTGWCCSSCKA
ncbi:UbiA prenyltransferase family-domain-containing protein [Scenedesmus sp. NREL 46B-D3]|nr:UbiA prenyltransferase family-domain-containing protein [Scenedesmus sp. NREL 46B-D3]